MSLIVIMLFTGADRLFEETIIMREINNGWQLENIPKRKLFDGEIIIIYSKDQIYLSSHRFPRDNVTHYRRCHHLDTIVPPWTG